MIQLSYLKSSDTIENLKTKMNENFRQLSNIDANHSPDRGFPGRPGGPGKTGKPGDNGITGTNGTNVYFFNEDGATTDIPPFSDPADFLSNGYRIDDKWFNAYYGTWYQILFDATSGNYEWKSNSSSSSADSFWGKETDSAEMYGRTLYKDSFGMYPANNAVDRFKNNVLISSVKEVSGETEPETASSEFSEAINGYIHEQFKIQIDQLSGEEGLGTGPVGNVAIFGNLPKKDFAPLVHLGQSKLATGGSPYDNFGISIYTNSEDSQILALSSTSGQILFDVNKLWFKKDILSDGAGGGEHTSASVRNVGSNLTHFIGVSDRGSVPTDKLATPFYNIAGMSVNVNAANLATINFKTQPSNGNPHWYASVTGNGQFKIDEGGTNHPYHALDGNGFEIIRSMSNVTTGASSATGATTVFSLKKLKGYYSGTTSYSSKQSVGKIKSNDVHSLTETYDIKGTDIMTLNVDNTGVVETVLSSKNRKTIVGNGSLELKNTEIISKVNASEVKLTGTTFELNSGTALVVKKNAAKFKLLQSDATGYAAWTSHDESGVPWFTAVLHSADFNIYPWVAVASTVMWYPFDESYNESGYAPMYVRVPETSKMPSVGSTNMAWFFKLPMISDVSSGSASSPGSTRTYIDITDNSTGSTQRNILTIA